MQSTVYTTQQSTVEETSSSQAAQDADHGNTALGGPSPLSLSLRLEIAHNYHCREDDNDNEDAQRDIGEDVGKVDFSQQLAGTL